RTEEAGKDVTKDVTGLPFGFDDINREATEEKSKRINLWQHGLEEINHEASKPITKPVHIVSRGLDTVRRVLSAYSTGTPTGGHPGGDAIMGDGKGSNAGSELVNLPSGK